MKISNSNFKWINTLRAYAILLVFWSHLEGAGNKDFLFILGRVGVVIFFLIAGYLSVLQIKTKSIIQYLFNRFIRMYPVYWVILILYFLVENYIILKNHISLSVLLANFTLFHQFLGFPQIIGPSWMMPILIIFFITSGLLKTKRQINNEIILDANRYKKIIIVNIALAVITGGIRYLTGKPFPTAIFLLNSVAFIGASIFISNYKTIKEWLLYNKNILFLFEVGLLVSSYYSYNNYTSYFISYNMGVLLFLYGMKNINNIYFKELGDMGFAFFLVADIPNRLMKYYFHFNFNESIHNNILAWSGIFVITYILSFAITEFVELPIRKWAVEIEKHL